MALLAQRQQTPGRRPDYRHGTLVGKAAVPVPENPVQWAHHAPLLPDGVTSGFTDSLGTEFILVRSFQIWLTPPEHRDQYENKTWD